MSEIERGVILHFRKIMLVVTICIMIAGSLAGCMSTPPAVGYTENSERFAMSTLLLFMQNGSFNWIYLVPLVNQYGIVRTVGIRWEFGQQTA